MSFVLSFGISVFRSLFLYVCSYVFRSFVSSGLCICFFIIVCLSFVISFFSYFVRSLFLSVVRSFFTDVGLLLFSYLCSSFVLPVFLYVCLYCLRYFFLS